MKVTVLTEILSTHSGSRAPIELAKHLSLDNKITLLAYSFLAEKGVKKELEKKGVKVILIDVLKAPFGKWLAAFKFLPYLKSNNLVSFHGTLPSFLIAKLSEKPIIKTYYGTQLDAYNERLLPDQKSTLKDKFLNWLGNQVTLLTQRIYFGLSTQVVAISQYTASEAQKLYGKKILFIHLGATEVPSPDEEHLRGGGKASQENTSEVARRQRRDSSDGEGTCLALPRRQAGGRQVGEQNTSEVKKAKSTTILSVSRITPYKGFHLLIKVVKKTDKKVNLFLVGSSSQPKYLQYLNKIKPPNTQVLVDVSNQELSNLYQDCDLYASCDRYLFFGLPILEAAQFGKPSVVLNYCAAKEVIIHQKTGFVAKDLDEFAKYLKILIDSVDLCTKMGKSAKIVAQKNFSWHKCAQKYQNLFENYPPRGCVE